MLQTAEDSGWVKQDVYEKKVQLLAVDVGKSMNMVFERAREKTLILQSHTHLEKRAQQSAR